MARFEYDVVDTVHGKKLVIYWADDQYPDGIKQLPWDTTHRSMYAPWWDDCDEKIVHGSVRTDEACWYIDWTDESISIFERHFGVAVPPKHTPRNHANNGVIEAIIPEGYTWFFLENPPKRVDQLLYQELSYKEPGAEYSDAYQSGEWDGISRLYDKSNHGAAVGLLDRAESLIDDCGYELTVTREGDRTSEPVELDWDFPHDLRDYQSEAITRVIDDTGGIVSLPTGTGKTITGLRLAYEMRRTMGRTIAFVHTQELLYQWADEIRDVLDVEPGMIGDSEWSEGPITVAIMQTLHSRGTDELENDYGVMVFDECHRTSAAETMHEIGMDIDTEIRIGLSATPWRRVSGEELKIEGATGNVVYEATAESMIDEDFLARPEFEIIDPPAVEAPSGMDYHEAYRHVISLNARRNDAIARKAARMSDDGYKVLINVNRVTHGKLLEYALNHDIREPGDIIDADDQRRREFVGAIADTGRVANTNAVFLSGQDDSDTRQRVLDEFENGDIDILVSTLLKEGVNIPAINGIILAQAGKSDIAQIQTIGRALRPKNGDSAKIVDIKDRGRFFGEQFDIRMTALNEYYGKYGPDADHTVRNQDGTVSLTKEPPTYDEVFGDG